MKHNYTDTRMLLRLLVFVAVLAALGTIIQAYRTWGLLPSELWIVTPFVGLVSAVGLAAVSLVGLAILDIADNTFELREAAAAFRRGAENASSAHPEKKIAVETPPTRTGLQPGEARGYRGHVIRRGNDGAYFVEGSDTPHDSLANAEKAVDVLVYKGRR